MRVEGCTGGGWVCSWACWLGLLCQCMGATLWLAGLLGRRAVVAGCRGRARACLRAAATLLSSSFRVSFVQPRREGRRVPATEGVQGGGPAGQVLGRQQQLLLLLLAGPGAAVRRAVLPMDVHRVAAVRHIRPHTGAGAGSIAACAGGLDGGGQASGRTVACRAR